MKPPDPTPEIALFAAIRKGDAAAAIAALNEGASPQEFSDFSSRDYDELLDFNELIDYIGWPPIALAAARGDLAVARALWSRGVDVDAPDRHGLTALIHVAASDH